MNRQFKLSKIFLTAILLVSTTVVVQAQSSEWTVPQSEDNVGLSTSPEAEEENGPTLTPANPNHNPPPPQATPPVGLPINDWIPGFLLIAGVFGAYVVKTTRKEA